MLGHHLLSHLGVRRDVIRVYEQSVRDFDGVDEKLVSLILVHPFKMVTKLLFAHISRFIVCPTKKKARASL